MFSKKNMRDEALRILKTPPSKKQMVRDLAMDNITIRYRGTDAPPPQALGAELLEKVWKVYMLHELVWSNTTEIERSGVGRAYFEDRLLDLFNEIEENKEGNGLTEFEVFKQKKTETN